jgi:hypothetical protein
LRSELGGAPECKSTHNGKSIQDEGYDKENEEKDRGNWEIWEIWEMRKLAKVSGQLCG